MGMEQAGDGRGVGDDPGHIGCGGEGADEQGATRVLDQPRFQLDEVDVAVGILFDLDHIGDRLSPRKFIGVVLIGPDEHHWALVIGDPILEPVGLTESSRYPDAEEPHQSVNSAGRAAPGEYHRVLVVAGPDRPADDLPRLLPEPGGLQPGARGFGVGVCVKREDLGADEILDHGQRSARGGVVGVGDPAQPERGHHRGVLPDHRLSHLLDQIHPSPFSG